MNIIFIMRLAGGLAVAGTCFLTSPARACGFDSLMEDAIEGDGATSTHAIEMLRDLGPVAMPELHRRFAADVEAARAHVEQTGQPPSDPRLLRVMRIFDTVGAQKDNCFSGLFWFTDLDRAKREAKQTGRPILSLRLLGRLDEDLSCANSRFFRSVLYADEAVGAMLRERFVLHWQTVRPAPRITIDFGDGRVIERTITGNSIHYVVDADGAIITALPGLYGPRVFQSHLETALSAFASCRNMSGESRMARLRELHHGQELALRRMWSSWVAMDESVELNLRPITAPRSEPVEEGAPAVIPAALAAPLAATKSFVEVPVLRRLDHDADELAARTDDAAWDRLASARRAECALDSNCRLMIRMKTIVDERDPMLFDAMIDRFEQSLALDTARNEFLFRLRIHEWLATGAMPLHDVDALNARVYAELFLTPESDPWLGLYDELTYPAVDHDGLRCDAPIVSTEFARRE